MTGVYFFFFFYSEVSYIHTISSAFQYSPVFLDCQVCYFRSTCPPMRERSTMELKYFEGIQQEQELCENNM